MPGPIGGGTPIPVKNLDLKSPLKKDTALPTTMDSQASMKHSQTISALSGAQSIAKSDVKLGDPTNDNTERRDSVGRPQSLMSMIFGNKKEEETDRTAHINITSTNAPLTSVEDFVPDDGLLDRSFLEDNSQASPQKLQHDNLDSESDTETANPLVAGYEDDLSSVDEVAPPVQPKLAENPLCKQKHKQDALASVELNCMKLRQNTKRDSVSSGEQELQITSNFSINEQQVMNSDPFDSCLEGGEDVSNSSIRKDRLELSDKSLDASVTSSNVHLELLDNSSMRQMSSNGSSPVMKERKKHKEKTEEKEKKKKKKSKPEKSDKSEKSEKSEKKKKRSLHHRARDENRVRDELEEFLNGYVTNRISVDVAYEAI